jgi:restriction system protein
MLQERFVGADYGIEADLTNELPDDWRQFNHKFIPIYLAKYPEKARLQPAWLAVHFGQFVKQ